MTDAEFGRRCGVTQQAVGLWRRGERMPGIDHVERIEKITAGEVRERDLLNAWERNRVKNETGIN